MLLKEITLNKNGTSKGSTSAYAVHTFAAERAVPWAAFLTSIWDKCEFQVH